MPINTPPPKRRKFTVDIALNLILRKDVTSDSHKDLFCFRGPDSSLALGLRRIFSAKGTLDLRIGKVLQEVLRYSDTEVKTVLSLRHVKRHNPLSPVPQFVGI
jgi:hypothetical protein